MSPQSSDRICRIFKISMMKISVVVPCYNEEGVLRATHERLSAVCNGMQGLDHELIFVNDGSADQTQHILAELQLRDPHVRVKIVQDHPTMAPSTSWELWLLPPGKAAPVSLGQVSLDPVQVMKLPPAAAAKMPGAWGMALSIEPAGGSPTGAPTGPIIFKGMCVKVL